MNRANTTTPPPPPSTRGPPHAPMEPPATPGPRLAREDSTPGTPNAASRTLPLATPSASHSPFPARTPRTPGGTSVSACTTDEDKYNLVTVHTAKCTECDKRNMDTMRRCPGCTFQVCQPCYEGRQKQGKGLVHGNMGTPGGAGSSGRAVRKKIVASTSGGKSEEKKKKKKKSEEVKKEDGEGKGKEKVQATKSAAGKKRAVKKPKAPDSDEAEVSSEDEFDPEDTSPTPSKRRRAKPLTFAESALATALRTPPATRASRKSVPTYQAPSSSPEPVDPQSSQGDALSNLEPTDILYQFGVKGYDEPLLGRREPIMSNPVALLPRTMDPSIAPRATADEHYKKIQDKTMEKLRAMQGNSLAMVRERATNNIATLWKDEDDGYPNTVRAFVESEAVKHHNAAMDEDDNKALFNAMEGAALVWGKQTYKKLDPSTQRMVQPGLKMRLDRIDAAYRVELGMVLAECAARVMRELVGEGQQAAPMAASPERQFKQG